MAKTKKTPVWKIKITADLPIVGDQWEVLADGKAGAEAAVAALTAKGCVNVTVTKTPGKIVPTQ